MGAEELLLNLFESKWFGINTKSPITYSNPCKPVLQQNLYDNDQYHDQKNLKQRSMSEQLLDPKLGSFFSSESSLSPSSVLASRNLQTIFSGKEANDDTNDQESTTKRIRIRRRRRKRSSGAKRDWSRLGGGDQITSKSLSELEFEELKGFMDLGFVFTEEECNDSKLVSMIPGLQRLCKKCNKSNTNDDDDDHDCGVSRPYLSEAWDLKNSNDIIKPLVIDWKMTSLGNEIFIKDQLKFWAHTVASTVR